MEIHAWTALTAGVLSLPLWAQLGGPCDCPIDAFYTDDPKTTEPGCVGSFGLTWTPEQVGICAHEECPPERSCTGEYTVSAASKEGQQCSWGLTLWDSTTGGSATVFLDEDFSVSQPYSLACGAYLTFDWFANGVHLGSHEFKCHDCSVSQG